MQTSVPKGTGGMLAVLGTDIEEISSLLYENKNKYIMLLEVTIQAGLTGIISFLFRDIIRYYRSFVPALKGSPERYAAIITGSALFYIQRNMRLKILHLLYGKAEFR